MIREDMGDEIRITVIATGFDTVAEVKLPTAPRAPEARAVGAPSHAPVKPADIILPDDLQPVENIDVPTFMRRQAD